MPRLEADVAIVGAGLAGLAAARCVSAAGSEAIVLEAREVVGGRTLNADIGDGAVVEIGGQWVGPTQERIAALAAELGVETFPTNTAGENLLRVDGRLRRYSGTIPKLGPLILLDVFRALRKLNRVSAGIDLEAPWTSPDAAHLDSISLGAWVDSTLRTAVARRLLRVAVRTIWGAEADELSMLHAAFYVRSGGSFELLTDVEGGAQQDRYVGGSQLISIRLADELGDRVLLSSPVRRIEHGPAGVLLHADGEIELHARRAIVAIPPPLTSRIDFDPVLPAGRRQLAQRMPQGWLVKTTAIYERPFWRDDGLSGEAVNEEGPVTMTFDNTPHGGSPGALVGFVGGGDARAFARLGSPSAARRSSAASSRFSVRRRRQPPNTSSRTGPPNHGSAAAPSATSPRAAGRPRDRRCASRWDRSTGPERRPQRSGTATWTVRSARGAGGG